MTDTKEFLYNLLKNNTDITNLVGNNIFFRTDEAYKALENNGIILLINFLNGKIDPTKRIEQFQLSLVGKTIEIVENLKTLIVQMFKNKSYNGVFFEIENITSLPEVEDAYMETVDIKMVLKD